MTKIISRLLDIEIDGVTLSVAELKNSIGKADLGQWEEKCGSSEHTELGALVRFFSEDRRHRITSCKKYKLTSSKTEERNIFKIINWPVFNIGVTVKVTMFGDMTHVEFVNLESSRHGQSTEKYQHSRTDRKGWLIPWWLNGKESTCQCRVGKIYHAAEQLSPCATTAKARAP